MGHHVQIHADEHVVDEGSDKCWCNPTILHREDHEDNIIVHFNAGQDHNLTTEDIDNILKVVEIYERDERTVELEGENSDNGQEAPKIVHDAGIRNTDQIWVSGRGTDH